VVSANKTAAFNSSLGIVSDFKGATLDLLNIKLEVK
jgi:hypothetical protein